MPRLALFDLDDTLIFSKGAFVAWAEELVATHGATGDVRWYSENEHIFWTGAPDDAFRGLVEYFGLDADPAELLTDYQLRMVDLLKPFDGVVDGLEALRDAGWRTGIVTNGFGDFQNAKIDAIGLRAYVDVVCISDVEGSWKPESKIFQLASERAGAPLEGGWMVGDSLTSDVAGGDGTGLHTAWIRHGRTLGATDPQPEQEIRGDHRRGLRADPRPALTFPVRFAGQLVSRAIRLDLDVTEASTFEEAAGRTGCSSMGTAMSWSIAQVARMSGITARSLRHYDEIGLLKPDHVGANGYRYYEEPQLLRLQQILVLRELGLGLADIAEAIDSEPDTLAALRRQYGRLIVERDRLSKSGRDRAADHRRAGREARDVRAHQPAGEPVRGVRPVAVRRRGARALARGVRPGPGQARDHDRRGHGALAAGGDRGDDPDGRVHQPPTPQSTTPRCRRRFTSITRASASGGRRTARPTSASARCTSTTSASRRTT